VPQIEVTFDIDADGILHVSAKDKATGREQSITITASSGLSKDEVESMVREAEQHRQEDERHRDQVEARNNADSLIYQAEKVLHEQGDKIPQDVQDEVRREVEATRAAMEGEDLDRLQQASQALAAAVQKVGASMYEQPGASPTEEGYGPTPEGDEDVIEGEYTES
jgi:molecular chaperone DnaK